MKVNILRAANILGKDYKKGIVEIPDSAANDDFFKALSKDNKILILSKYEEAPKPKRGRKPNSEKAASEEKSTDKTEKGTDKTSDCQQVIDAISDVIGDA